MPSLNPKQFMKEYHPGEYSHKWRSVASNREFLKGAPIGDLIEDVDQNGIQTPVTVYQKHVVDGHHRVIAAAVTGRDVPFTQSDDPRYDDQVALATRARIRGDASVMPSNAPMYRGGVPPRLREFLGWKTK